MKRTKQFGDIELYRMIKETRIRFTQILTDVQKTVRVSGTAVQMCQKFRECLKPTEEIDESRLPLLSKTMRSMKKNKIRCVMCLISHTMQLYWGLCSGNKNEEIIVSTYLGMLEVIIENGLWAYRLGGNVNTGYYLEKR